MTTTDLTKAIYKVICHHSDIELAADRQALAEAIAAELATREPEPVRLDPAHHRALSGDPAPAVEVVEHAIQMSGGGMHVRWDDPEMERVYPLADWIPAQQRFGGKVYRRTVIVVEDWEEVPS